MSDLSSLKDKEVILCSDLDGTFLGGSLESRQALHRFIEQNRDRVGLVYVTGRSEPAYQVLHGAANFDPVFNHRDPHQGQIEIPHPDLLITNVGARAADGSGATPVPAVQAWAEGQWNKATPKVRQALAGEPGLTLHEAPDAPHLVYLYDQAKMQRPIEDVARDLQASTGVNTVVSHGMILDVLPQGVDKARGIERALQAAGLTPQEIRDKVMVAGDSMNDYAMLTHGFKGVMVGNAHEELKRALPRNPRIHRAQGAGAAGVQEGLEQFFPQLKQAPAETGAVAPGRDRRPDAVPKPAPSPVPSVPRPPR